TRRGRRGDRDPRRKLLGRRLGRRRSEAAAPLVLRAARIRARARAWRDAHDAAGLHLGRSRARRCAHERQGAAACSVPTARRARRSAAVVFEVHHETRGGSGSDWSLVPWAVNETASSLPPGEYELVLWDDDLAEQRVPVHVVAGETTDVAVTLQPK